MCQEQEPMKLEVSVFKNHNINSIFFSWAPEEFQGRDYKEPSAGPGFKCEGLVFNFSECRFCMMINFV